MDIDKLVGNLAFDADSGQPNGSDPEGANEGDKTPATDANTNAQARDEHMKNILDGNSKLGREVKHLKEQVETLTESLQENIAQLANQQTPQTPYTDYDNYGQQSQYLGYDSNVQYDQWGNPMQPLETEEARIKRIIAEERSAHNAELDKVKEKYVSAYESTVEELSQEEDPAIFKAILAEMEDLPGRSDDGSADARLNYQIAERNVYKKLYKNPELKETAFKEQPAVGGPGGPSQIQVKEQQDADFNDAMKDEHVRKYMRLRGKDEEFVKKAMKRNAPYQGVMKII